MPERLDAPPPVLGDSEENLPAHPFKQATVGERVTSPLDVRRVDACSIGDDGRILCSRVVEESQYRLVAGVHPLGIWLAGSTHVTV